MDSDTMTRGKLRDAYRDLVSKFADENDVADIRRTMSAYKASSNADIAAALQSVACRLFGSAKTTDAWLAQWDLR